MVNKAESASKTGAPKDLSLLGKRRSPAVNELSPRPIGGSDKAEDFS